MSFEFHVFVSLYIFVLHYENLPMQYTEIFFSCKNYFQLKNFGIFLIFPQNIDCGYTLEPSQPCLTEAVLTSSHNLFFGAKIPQFCYIKVGYKGVYITQTCYHDVDLTIFCSRSISKEHRHTHVLPVYKIQKHLSTQWYRPLFSCVSFQ